MKTARFKSKNTKPKHTQTEFPFVEHVKGRKIEPEYTPPKPSEMTVKELEDWCIAGMAKGYEKRIENEILKRMHEGVKFSRFKEMRYIGREPFLVPVFKPEEDEKN